MDDVATAIERWIPQHLPPLWVVVVAALVLAWFDQRAKLRRMGRYDGWWFNTLRRADAKLLRRTRRS